MIRIMTNSNGQELNGRFVLIRTENDYQPDVFYTHYREFVVSHLQKDNFYSDHKNIEKQISSTLDDLQRKIRDTKDDGKIEKRAEKYRYYASVLSASRHLVDNHTDSFTVPDIYRAEGFPTEIPLRNDISISENIDLFYKKARSAANSIEENAKRHQSFLKDFEIWEKLYKDIQEIKDSKTLRDWKKENKDILNYPLLRTPNSHTLSKKRGANKTSIQGIHSRWMAHLGREIRKRQ
jgi:hypothetical protein